MKTSLALLVIVLVGVLTTATLAHAQPTATAQAAFQQGEALEKQGQWAEACKLYDTSYRADAQLGVLLYLANCHEHIGLIATAAAEFDDAAELAHRKGDNREAVAQAHADALKPRLAHLHLAPPATPIPGLVVSRDGIDISVLVGTDMPTDPGEHEIVATAPGRLEWRKKITIGALPTTVPIDIPPLELAPVTPVHPDKPIDTPPHEVRDGTVRITTQPSAHILIDTHEVGIGHYDAKIRPGGHTLRVVADGMRPYQSEIVIGDDETRAIDVPLEAAYIAPPIEPAGPSYELGASFSPGVKEHGDRPAVLATRIELALRRGHRVNFGLFAEYGSIDPNSGVGACGSDMAGSRPSTPFDFGARNQFTSCTYVMPGLQLYVHILPKRRFDPYVGIASAFRFGFMKWTPVDPGGAAGVAQSEVWPGVVEEVRVGLDYHPRPSMPGLEIGALISAEITAAGEEASSSTPDSHAQHYVSLFGGLRSTIAF